jgi:hypothetical protein
MPTTKPTDHSTFIAKMDKAGESKGAFFVEVRYVSG